MCRAVESMNVPQNEKDDIKRFYLDIAAETQRLKNRVTGKVSREFKPKRAIEEINDMINSKPTVVFQVTEPPKVQKVIRAIPQGNDSGEPILVQMKAFVETLTTPKTNL